ncbi:MAG: M67 family metallopeptidase [Sphaerobacter sp.]|nr:M67 family metallopeptidase [Sphaerobacter sp.]
MAGDDQNGTPEALVIDAPLYHEMIEHVRSVAPIEGVGLIAFAGDRAVKIYRGTNVEQSTTRYSMDPTEVVAALNEMDQHGWQLGAIFHSHPRSEAAPSPTDLRHAYYPNALMVIISLLTDPPVVRAFRVDGEVREVPVRVLPEEGTAETA